MPNKIQQYTELAAQTARQVTGSLERWTAFLDTAARLYKYPFHEQIQIYAQRPEATACAEYSLWNDRMGRYVRRGSNGIALVDNTGNDSKLRFVFDIADTGGKRRPHLWQFRPAHEAAVSAALEERSKHEPISLIDLHDAIRREHKALAKKPEAMEKRPSVLVMLQQPVPSQDGHKKTAPQKRAEMEI